MANTRKDVGEVTAYAYAVAGGYTGTKEEFAEMMASYATVAEEAAESAEAAAGSASTAVTAKDTAVSARDAAVAAQGAAESARTAAESAKDSAVTAKTSAESAATSADASKTAAQTARTGAEAARNQAVTAKDDAVTAKTAAESAQTAAETAQGLAEDAQSAAETAQAAAEEAARTLTIDDTLTQAGQAAEAKATGDALDTKANVDGAYQHLTAGMAQSLETDDVVTDTKPYLYRKTGADAVREYDEIVGGSVVVNQLVTNGNFADGTAGWNGNNGELSANAGKLTYTPTASTAGHSFVQAGAYARERIAGHKYLYMFYASVSTTGIGSAFAVDPINETAHTKTLTANTDTFIGGIVNASTSGSNLRPLFYPWGTAGVTTAGTETATVHDVQIIDLTQMFGSAIADYAYSLEQATAGSGIAWLKSYGFFGDDYIPYNAGTLTHISGLTAHIMRDADNNVISNYALDSTLTLRGIPKLSGDQLYYDGDVYSADGSVSRRYAVVDLGTLNWTNGGKFRLFFSKELSELIRNVSTNAEAADWIKTAKFDPISYNGITGSTANRICVSAIGSVGINDGNEYGSIDDFKAAMSGVMLIYELATPTTESATPYQSPQICDPDGTEEYVGSAIPVGHNTKYPANLVGRLEKLPDIPTTAGTYNLQVTVTSGKATAQWVSV